MQLDDTMPVEALTEEPIAAAPDAPGYQYNIEPAVMARRSAEFELVPIGAIETKGEIDGLDPDIVDAFAASIAVLGLKQPIEVIRLESGFELVAGRYRLSAMLKLGWPKVPVRIIQLISKAPDAETRLHRAFENLLRRELTALERMEHLAAAKEAHDAVYPNASKDGRRRTRQAAENCATLAQFSFSATAAEKIGLGRRTVETAIAVWNGLSIQSRARLRGTVLADRQAELVLLAKEAATTQVLVLNLLLSTPPSAADVTEALAMIRRVPTPTAEERRITKLSESFAALTPEARRRVLDANEEAVRAYAAEKGWVTGGAAA